MNHRSNGSRRAGQVFGSVAVTAVLALGTTACAGNDSTAGASDSARLAPDTKKATKDLNAGLEAHANGDLTAAAADYHKVLEYDPENKFALYNLALIDAASGNYGLAEAKYRSALKSDPTYEPALFNLAILRTGRDPKEAISLYRRAVASDPKDASAWLNLGLLLRAAGQNREGNKDVLRALALDPKLEDPAGKAEGGS